MPHSHYLLLRLLDTLIQTSLLHKFASLFLVVHFHSLSRYCLHAVMAGQCLNIWCGYHAQIFSNTTACPSCFTDLTPIIPSYAAPQPIDAGFGFPSLIPSSPWDPTPVLSEQMKHVSNNGDMCSTAVSQPGQLSARLRVLTAFAKAYPIPRSPDRNSFLDSQAPFTPSSNEGLDSHKEQQNLRVRAWVPEKGAKETCSPACISCYNSSPVLASVHGG